MCAILRLPLVDPPPCKHTFCGLSAAPVPLTSATVQCGCGRCAITAALRARRRVLRRSGAAKLDRVRGTIAAYLHSASFCCGTCGWIHTDLCRNCALIAAWSTMHRWSSRHLNLGVISLTRSLGSMTSSGLREVDDTAEARSIACDSRAS